MIDEAFGKGSDDSTRYGLELYTLCIIGREWIVVLWELVLRSIWRRGGKNRNRFFKKKIILLKSQDLELNLSILVKGLLENDKI